LKKLTIAALLAISTSAFAADVTVSTVRDYQVEKTGYRIGTTVAGLGLSATVVEDKYNRYAVGKDFNIAKVGPVAFSAGVAGVYQDTAKSNANGFGLTVGSKATYDINKNVTVVAGVERFIGQNRVSASNGNVGSLGLNIKF
jgi:hypothetical protein